MKLSKAVKPLSYVRANAAGIIRSFSKDQAPPVVITQNGEAKAVLMGIEEYERMTERLAMRQLLDASTKSIEEGRTFSLDEGFQTVQEQIKARFEK